MKNMCMKMLENMLQSSRMVDQDDWVATYISAYITHAYTK